MSTIPRTDDQAVSFFINHAAQWAAHAAAVGLTQAEADKALALATAAAQARRRAFEAREAAEAATQDMERALAAMRSTGGKAIAKIRAYAAITDDPAVLVTASLAPASTRRAPLPPAQPTIVEARLLTTGAITLKWRVRHTQETRAEGTQYLVMRMIPGVAGEDRWRMLPGGLIGGRGRAGHEFTDETMPALGTSTRAIQYRVIPQRAGIQGPSSLTRTVVLGAAMMKAAASRAAA